MDNMSYFHSLLPPISTPPLVLLLLLTSLLPHTALSQTPGGFGTSPPGPTMADCGTRLLPLVPCAPFVQGTATSPAQSCCDGLIQLNNQQPACLCLLLNNSDALSSFPINSTLALELPLLCNLQFDTSSCSGMCYHTKFFANTKRKNKMDLWFLLINCEIKELTEKKNHFFNNQFPP